MEKSKAVYFTPKDFLKEVDINFLASMSNYLNEKAKNEKVIEIDYEEVKMKIQQELDQVD
jgi:hypothetical protein